MKRFTFLATITAPFLVMFRKNPSIRKDSEWLYNIRYTIGHDPVWEQEEWDDVTEEYKEQYKKNLTSLIESIKYE